MSIVANGRLIPRKLWVVLALASSAIAQPGPQIQLGELPSDAKESLQNVTVNDSPEARKDIETAHGMEGQREWDKAAGWYQEVLTKYRSRVVPWKVDRLNVINSYRGIVYQVQESLAKWPVEGINIYRARYESAAATAMEGPAGNDAGTLQSVLDTWFLTESAKTAGIRLIDLHLEAGEYDAAARVGQLLLENYPAPHLVAERPRLLYRTALALHLCGDDAGARARADELKQKYPEAKAAVFGAETVLTDSLEKLLTVAAGTSQHLSPDSWTMFGGSPDRSHVSTAQGRMGARLFSIELPARPVPRGAPQQVLEQKQFMQNEEAMGRTVGIMPVVDGTRLYFQDGASIWAVGLDSGIALPGWAGTYPGRGTYRLKNAVSPRNQQYTLTLSEDAVLGVLGQANRMQMAYANQGLYGLYSGPATTLVCLDRETGRERWSVSPNTLAGESLKDDERERLRALDFSGSPVVVGGNVYITGRGGKDLQFENCYVICLDVATGLYRWSCLIASANSGMSMFSGDAGQVGGTTSHLAYSSGRIYVSSNLGALAAVDAANGSIIWLSLYPREELDTPTRIRGRRMWVQPTPGGAVQPWECNAVLFQDGKLFFMPTDGKHLLVYNAANGQEIKRVDLNVFKPDGIPDRPTTIVGIVGDLLVMTSSRRAYMVDWKKYDVARGEDFESNRLRDAVGVSAWFGTSASVHEHRAIRGRVFLTKNMLYVPTDKCLNGFDVRILPAPSISQIYPPAKNKTWDEKEGPGNVVVTDDHVILATSTSVDVYTDMTLARAKLDREVAAAPEDATPRLQYAEVMLAAGQPGLAIEKINDAARLLGGMDALRPGALRHRLFNDALTFARKLARERQADSVEAAIRCFDIAGKAAEQPSEQVDYRFSRAQFMRDNVQPDSYTTAVRLYQEILSRPELRTVGVQSAGDATPESGGQAQAGVEAEQRIKDVIRQHPEAYEIVGAEAAVAFATAQAAGDPAALLGAAEIYPNASGAPQALLSAADLFERAHNPRQAGHVLRQALQKYGNSADRSRLVEAIVRNSLGFPGGYEVAIGRLRRMGNAAEIKLSRPIELPDGTKIQGMTFSQAADALQKAKPPEPAPPLPDVHVAAGKLTDAEKAANKPAPKPFHPLDDRTLSPVIADVASLVQPPADEPDAIRTDRVVAMIGNQLSLIAPGATKPLGHTDVLTDQPLAGVWKKLSGGKSVLLVWSNNEIVAVNGDTAVPLWIGAVKALPDAEVITSTGMRGAEVVIDSLPPVDPNALDNQQMFGGGRRGGFGGPRNRGFAAVVVAQPVPDPDPQLPNRPEQISHARALSDRVILGTSGGRVVCLNLADGKLLWQTRLGRKPITKLVANEDFTAVKITGDGAAELCIMDNFNGQIRMQRHFGDPNLTPINIALSPDGMLVWTLADRMCGKDLYEPEPSRLTFEEPSRQLAQGAQPYLGCDKPGQLQIHGRQIIAVRERGRFVSVHHLDNGKQETSASTIGELSAGAPQGAPAPDNEISTSIRIVGPCLYIWGPQTLAGYRLDEPGYPSFRPSYSPWKVNFRIALPTKDLFLMITTEPSKHVEATRIFQLRCYVPLDGRILYAPTVNEMASISTWQAVDGGVYYLSDDHLLHFMRGTRE